MPEFVTVGIGIGIGIAIAIRAKEPAAIATPIPIPIPRFDVFRLILRTGLNGAQIRISTWTLKGSSSKAQGASPGN
jgi:hypothetical protein